MEWQEICEHPSLRNMPFKIETNKWGKIVMTPATNKHGVYQALIIEWLSKLGAGGRPISECSIQTSDGVKVADVAWGSFEFFKKNKLSNPYLESPEIIVEILSPSNTFQEMEEKRELYFARGAKEFWTCDEEGLMRFYTYGRKLDKSEILEAFPEWINIDFA